MALSADMHARIFGPRPLNQLFAPYGSGDKVTLGALLPTLPASVEPHVTSAFHKLGVIEREPDPGAAGGGAGAARSARRLRATSDAGTNGPAHLIADTTRRGAHVSQAAHGAEAIATTSNPVYGGLLVQSMYGDAGIAVPRYVEPAGGAAAHVDDAADVADDIAAGVQHEAAAAGGGAAATAGKPATAAERSMMASFEQLSTLAEPQRIDVLSGALEHRFAAGKGPSTLEVLTRALIDGPFEDSAPAMEQSLERVLAGGAADVAAATVRAAPAAADVAAARAAPVAAETVAHAVPTATAAAAHAAPAAAEALAHAAPTIADAAGHAAPAASAALDHAAPLLDDALASARALLRGGGTTRLYGMEDGVMQALRLLRR